MNWKKHINIFFVLLSNYLFAQSVADYDFNISFHSGNNKLLISDYTENKTKYHSFIIQPHHSYRRVGLRIGYVKEYSGGHYVSDSGYSYYTNDVVFFYIQPQFYLQWKYLGAVPGILFVKILETEDGPGELVVPTISLRFGELNKFFVSIDILNDIFFGLYSINLNYLFKDNISKLMVGLVKSEEYNYTGISYDFHFKVFKNFFFAIRGNLKLKDGIIGTQVGAGFTI